MKNRRKKEGNGYLQFAGVIMAGAVLGGAGGFLMNFYQGDMKQIADIIENEVRANLDYLLYILAAAGSILNGLLVFRAKKNLRKWDGEDEEQAEAIERYNSRCQGIISVLTIFNMTIGIPSLSLENDRALLSCICFVLYALWSALAINRLVEYQKTMNPEKRGNALSLHFDKEWLASCDEREKVKMYEAAYRVYIRSQYVYGGLFIFLMLISMVVPIGYLPNFIVGFIWMFQAVTYYRSYEKL